MTNLIGNIEFEPNPIVAELKLKPDPCDLGSNQIVLPKLTPI